MMLQHCWTLTIVSGRFNDFSSVQIAFLTVLWLEQKFLERNIQEHSINSRIRWKAVRTRSFCWFETKSHAVQANLELTKWLTMIGTRDSPAFTSPVLEAQTTIPAVLSCSATVSPCTSTSRMLGLQMCGGTRGFLERNRIPHRSKAPITKTVIISLISRSHLLGSDRKQVSNTGGTRLGSL